ncbi:hypothetical protein BO70DRAFT_374636 [Aspergillus heteromorphus CBS 117.55]|uniref:Zn(2)-C6 fungal-type domain-containing protein n=1 Tax=Aspergillus heteromorphus CBS 117.55 TaxID=1448321 RepID=A0A317V1E2_9EURO|nr:uncharacterized protein BO70DRAFT_374636 [Aspergillus heteromorphus CBS 117.55]PWY67211.1 hypothetical protein BO70DRAFT_374636 [Aspergillus heteromorphus CBS 117.55]
MQAPRARGTGRSGPRRRTGCLTCRLRKVRCDEAKPTCANCTRLRLSCSYKTIVPGIATPHDPHALLTTATATATAPSPISASADRPDANFFHTKHLDLTTNGLAGFPAGSTPAAIASEELVPDERPISWGPTDLVPAPGARSDRASSDSSAGGSRVTYEDQLFAYFIESDPPPTIFGPVNLEWEYVRANIVRLSRDSMAVLHGVYCYAEIHEAMMEGKAWKLAANYHQLACSEVQACLLGEVDEAVLRRVFATVLLLMLAEEADVMQLLSTPDLWGSGTSFLHSAYLLLQRFHVRTKSWTGVSRLIVSWVSLLDVKALIAGRDGDPLIELGRLSPQPSEDRTLDASNEDEPPTPAYLIREAITGPAFHFFLQTQQVIRRIVCIDLHHRSRGTVSDEFEVLQIAHEVGADLETLWNRRPRVLDVYGTPESLSDTLRPAVAVETCRTFRQYIANFLAIFIYLHRVAFAIYPRTDRVHRAVDRIIQLATAEVESAGGAQSQSHLPASFVWPLFVAGLEGSVEQRRWIVTEMQRITGASRSDARGQGSSRHPHAGKALVLLQEMTRRQDASRTWADSRCVRRELFTDFFVMI